MDWDISHSTIQMEEIPEGVRNILWPLSHNR
jgi:hypothetical protein